MGVPVASVAKWTEDAFKGEGDMGMENHHLLVSPLPAGATCSARLG